MTKMTDYTVSVADQVAADVPIITLEAARNIVEDHRISWLNFIEDNGVKSAYNTRNVFNWLGY